MGFVGIYGDRIIRAALPLFISLFIFTGRCAATDRASQGTDPPAAFQANQQIGSLRELADGRGFQVGGLYHDYTSVVGEWKDRFNNRLAGQFNSLSTTYSFNMDEVRTAPEDWLFRYADRAVKFATDNNMEVRGTHLLWYATLPDWFTDGNYSVTQAWQYLEEFITTMVSRYAAGENNPVRQWNVVNEVLSDSDGEFYRDDFLNNTLPAGWIGDAFRAARAADPDAKLFINDYGILGNATDNQNKRDRLFQLVDSLLNEGVPVDGVGFQGHFSVEENLSTDYIRETLDLFGNRGLEIQITELDVLVNNDESGLNQTKLRDQANIMALIFQLCLEHSACTGVTQWGVADRDHFVNNGGGWWLDQDKDWPTMFDMDYNPKPAFDAVREVF